LGPITDLKAVAKRKISLPCGVLHKTYVSRPIADTAVISVSKYLKCYLQYMYDSVSTSFRNGCLERELQMVQLSATRCSCIAILWVSLVSFAATTLCVAFQRVFIVVSVYFVMKKKK
jgi:hypothetical protein